MLKKPYLQECYSCGASWSVRDEQDSCPFCGAVLKKHKAISTIENALSDLVDEYGRGIFAQGSKLVSLLSDTIPELENERRLIKLAVEAGVYKELCLCSYGDEARTVEKCLSILTDSYYINEGKAREVLAWCADAIALNVSLLSKRNEESETTDYNANYETEKREDRQSVQATEREPDQTITGLAVKEYDDGSIFRGNLLNGEKAGFGIMLYSQGDVYRGNWNLDRREGQGTMLYANGDIYQGNWFLDNKKDQGKMIYNNGDVYDGHWKYDMKEGYGKMQYSDGSIYEGRWKNNVRNGHGKFTTVNGDVFECEWKNGKRDGQYRIAYHDGRREKT